MSYFNTEFNKIIESSGLKNAKETDQQLNDVSQFILKDNINSAKKQTPFKNEFIVKAAQQNDTRTSTAIRSLQQKIMETNFTEPKSLMRANSNMNNDNQRNSSKKRKIMGLPNHDGHKFEVSKPFELETVHEKIKDKKNSFLYDSGVKPKVMQGSVHGSVTKKVVHGNIVTTTSHAPTISRMAKNESNLRIRNTSLNSSLNRPDGLVRIESSSQVGHKSNFTNLGAQILYKKDQRHETMQEDDSYNFGTVLQGGNISKMKNMLN